jgi:galactokinase
MSWFAPGRVNLIGEHTDYNGGPSLAFAIHLGVTATATPRPDRTVRVSSLQTGETVDRALDELEPGRIEGWAAYPLGVVWAMRARLPAGLDLTIDGDVPAGAGLSSSAALTNSVARAVDDALGLASDPAALVEDAIRGEREFVGVPCGGLDQRVSAQGRPGHAVVHDGATGQVRLVPVQIPCRFLVVPLAERHDLTDGAYAARRGRCEDAARSLGVPALAAVPLDDLPAAMHRLDPASAALVRHVVTETHRVGRVLDLVDGGDPAALGAIVSASHRSLRDDFGGSTNEADRLVDDVVGDGALGARIIGGGGGGSVLAVLDAGDTDLRGGFLVTPDDGWRRR